MRLQSLVLTWHRFSMAGGSGPRFRQYTLLALDPPPSAAGFESSTPNLDLVIGVVSSWDGNASFVDMRRRNVWRWLDDVNTQIVRSRNGVPLAWKLFCNPLTLP